MRCISFPRARDVASVQWTLLGNDRSGAKTSNDLVRQDSIYQKKGIHRMSFFDKRERETGLEPAAPTLARSCSTN